MGDLGALRVPDAGVDQGRAGSHRGQQLRPPRVADVLVEDALTHASPMAAVRCQSEGGFVRGYVKQSNIQIK